MQGRCLHAREVLRDAMVMQGGKRLLTVNGMSSARGGRSGRDDGLCAAGGGGAVYAWRKKGRQSVGVVCDGRVSAA
ncbi:hypothetical protein MRB53_014250 [Persea americana]|uniref:Uncharacterized protein n=1 Tax=Persea americana TaxID=3435 RepID=A0ACC2KAB4_PERAE|nr:hypothetical protein MRB53_014250 [Persea americana]